MSLMWIDRFNSDGLEDWHHSKNWAATKLYRGAYARANFKLLRGLIPKEDIIQKVYIAKDKTTLFNHGSMFPYLSMLVQISSQ